MLILGISTSSKHPSAAVSLDGRIAAFRMDESGKSHSATLMELIEGVLSDCGADVSDIGAIAVDVGPGSFTGVRIGVSCANAMASALSVKVIPVTSLYALSFIAEGKDVVCSLIDCRNGNCYAAVYGYGEEQAPPCAAVTEDFLKDVPEDAVIVGDCMGRNDHPDAALVLSAAKKNGRASDEAVPMYLRPSQAERMKSGS